MRDYEAATGQAVRFQCAYAGSGTQARAVIDGLPADIGATEQLVFGCGFVVLKLSVCTSTYSVLWGGRRGSTSELSLNFL